MHNVNLMNSPLGREIYSDLWHNLNYWPRVEGITRAGMGVDTYDCLQDADQHFYDVAVEDREAHWTHRQALRQVGRGARRALDRLAARRVLFTHRHPMVRLAGRMGWQANPQRRQEARCLEATTHRDDPARRDVAILP